MEFEVGKLYKCSKHLLMIYPTRENAMVAEQANATVAWVAEHANATVAWVAEHANATVAWAAGYWSKKLGCSVRYSEPDEIFIFIKEEIIEEQKYLKKYLNVLFGDKQGWIVYKDWMEIERVL